jgi:hypothetical protein
MKTTLCFLGLARFLLPQAGPQSPQPDPPCAVPCFFDRHLPPPCPAVTGCRDLVHRSSTGRPTVRTGPPLSAGRAPSTGPHPIPFYAAIPTALMLPVLAHPATPKPRNVCALPSCCSPSKPHRRRTSERW